MNIYQGIFIFIMLKIISFCTSQTLERLRRNPEQGKVCRNNNECRSYEKCTDRKCENSCYNLNCRPGEGCFVSNHRASCQCQPGFAYNSSRTCVKTCSFDSDCGQHETCQKVGGILECKCRAGFEIDTFANDVCRWKCSHDGDCAPGSMCLHERCVDYCDGVECARDEYCDFGLISRRMQCLCLNLKDLDHDGRCRRYKY